MNIQQVVEKLIINIDSLPIDKFQIVEEKLNIEKYHLKAKELEIPPAFNFLYWYLANKSFKELNIFFDLVFKNNDNLFSYLFPARILPFQDKINKFIYYTLKILRKKPMSMYNFPLASLFYLEYDDKLLEKRKNLYALLKEKYGAKSVELISGNIWKIEERLKHSNAELIFVNYSYLDVIGHIYGPHSSKYLREINLIVNSINKILERLRPNYIEIFSDHGMYEVKEYLNPYNLFDLRKCRFIINTPFIRFKKCKFEDKIIEKLKEMERKGFGKIIDEDILRKFDLPWKESYGDFAFWLRRGFGFSPDFYWGYFKYKGMHNYIEGEKTKVLKLEE